MLIGCIGTVDEPVDWKRQVRLVMAKAMNIGATIQCGAYGPIDKIAYGIAKQYNVPCIFHYSLMNNDDYQLAIPKEPPNLRSAVVPLREDLYEYQAHDGTWVKPSNISIKLLYYTIMYYSNRLVIFDDMRCSFITELHTQAITEISSVSSLDKIITMNPTKGKTKIRNVEYF